MNPGGVEVKSFENLSYILPVDFVKILRHVLLDQHAWSFIELERVD